MHSIEDWFHIFQQKSSIYQRESDKMLRKGKNTYRSVCHRNIQSFHGATKISMFEVTSLYPDINSPCFLFLQIGNILSTREGLQPKHAIIHWIFFFNYAWHDIPPLMSNDADHDSYRYKESFLSTKNLGFTNISSAKHTTCTKGLKTKGNKSSKWNVV